MSGFHDCFRHTGGSRLPSTGLLRGWCEGCGGLRAQKGSVIKRIVGICARLPVLACYVLGSLIPAIMAGCSSKSDDATVHGNRGITHFEKGEYDQAIADCTAAIRIQPDLPMRTTWRRSPSER